MPVTNSNDASLTLEMQGQQQKVGWSIFHLWVESSNSLFDFLMHVHRLFFKLPSQASLDPDVAIQTTHVIQMSPQMGLGFDVEMDPHMGHLPATKQCPSWSAAYYDLLLVNINASSKVLKCFIVTLMS